MKSVKNVGILKAIEVSTGKNGSVVSIAKLLVTMSMSSLEVGKLVSLTGSLKGVKRVSVLLEVRVGDGESSGEILGSSAVNMVDTSTGVNKSNVVETRVGKRETSGVRLGSIAGNMVDISTCVNSSDVVEMRVVDGERSEVMLGSIAVNTVDTSTGVNMSDVVETSTGVNMSDVVETRVVEESCGVRLDSIAVNTVDVSTGANDSVVIVNDGAMSDVGCTEAVTGVTEAVVSIGVDDMITDGVETGN